MTHALLIIDVQQGLCEGRRPAFAARAVIGRIRRLAEAARAARAPVIWVQHESADELPRGSRAWQLADGLRAEPGDVLLAKTTPDAFQDTPLAELLREHGVDRLIVCGMHTEFCVDTTCRRALALGWRVLLAQDAHTSAGNEVLTAPQVIAHHNATLSAIGSFGARVQTWPTDALVHRLQGLPA